MPLRMNVRSLYIIISLLLSITDLDSILAVIPCTLSCLMVGEFRKQEWTEAKIKHHRLGGL